jgi:hypothetical protein
MRTFKDDEKEFTRVDYKINLEPTVGMQGAQGYHGPNDMGYAIVGNMQLAMDLRKTMASAYYGYGNKCVESKINMINSHLAKALIELGKFDKEYCHMANWEHDPAPFDPTTV